MYYWRWLWVSACGLLHKGGVLADWLKVVILGIVEGITEFLPISSTGHLIVAAAFLDFNTTSGTFEIFIQIGAVVAVVFYFWGDIWYQIRNVGRDKGVQRFWLAIIIGSIPAAVSGFLLRDWIKTNLFTPSTVAISLIIGGIIFLVVERRHAGEQAEAQTTELEGISIRQAIGVGLAQTIALIPGVSRSGASIIGGLFVGMNRTVATRFSFYLAIPVLGGATVFELLTSLDEIDSNELINLLLGAVISGVVAWLAIRWLLNYVSRNSFVPFGYYRIIAGGLILLLIAIGFL